MATIKQARIVFTPSASADTGLAFSKLIVSTQKSPVVLRPSDRVVMSKARAGRGHIMADLVRDDDRLTAVFSDHRVAECFHLRDVGDVLNFGLAADAKTRGNYNVLPEQINEFGFSVELIETELVLKNSSDITEPVATAAE